MGKGWVQRHANGCYSFGPDQLDKPVEVARCQSYWAAEEFCGQCVLSLHRRHVSQGRVVITMHYACHGAWLERKQKVQYQLVARSEQRGNCEWLSQRLKWQLSLIL